MNHFMDYHLITIQEVFINEPYRHLNIIEIYFHCTFSHQVFVKCLHSGSICNKRWKFNYEGTVIIITGIEETNRLGNTIEIVTDIFTYIMLTIDVLYKESFYECVYRSVFYNVLLTYIDRTFMVKHFCYFTTFYKHCCYLFIW